MSNKQKKSKTLIISCLLFLISAGISTHSVAAETSATPIKDALEITVYRSPTCGCCHKWVETLEKDGFTVSMHDSDDMDSVKQSFGLQSHLHSCHTGTIGGYVIEGHVPAADIRRLLNEKPKAAGLTAPGMPRHSPGMQPVDEQPKDYDVLLFDTEGKTAVYTSY